ncbi:Glucan endo-1,3-beta-D-glucosidase [Handroanthus impetiginosus]|uniref:Glucan endo-1,3-beta-D-glucosidase n=1 Tax=Handroanthus impetiginosus TaxID=429701 RepID=A0A2G9I7Z7_9LAMI|nr:Glucan endo-1,3-beta-D-glucosidase [Handroanthus impetiginosus]
MSKGPLSFCLLSLFLGLVMSSCNGNPTIFMEKYTRQWCITKPNAQIDKLQGFIDYACSQPHVDCHAINLGGPCFEPNTLRSHAAYALNQIYRVKGVCDPNFGITIIDDPSYGNCHYP